MVRMVDVASHAGVSIKTVSRVLNNEPHVQDSLREKVYASVEKLGYVPSASARSLRSNRTYTFHLISPVIVGNYINTVQAGAISASQKHGYNLLVTPLEVEVLDDSKALNVWCRELIEKKKPDGVILVPPLSDNLRLNEIFNEAGVPISRIGPNKIDDVNNASIIIDDRASAKEATQELIALGHKRIGFVRGIESQGATQERYYGYCDALENAGISIDPTIVKPGVFSFESGMNAGLELLSLNNRPTAIFAANDDMATGVIVSAYRTGIAVPDELSVMGFDDSELAEKIWPALSTIRQPVVDFGKSAVEHLVNRAGKSSMKRPDKQSLTEILDYKIILRGSTAQVPQV